ncbi:MAG: hypothetical protein ACFE8B_04850, partial [Candidatus Hermodarchaeota archaeon]
LTKDANGSDIKGICTEAGMYAIRRNSETISYDDLINAINKVMKTKSSDQSPISLFI